MSVAVLFVDLFKAFDKVLREIVLGWPQNGNQGAEYLEKLSVDREHARKLAAEINQSTVLEEAGVPELARELLTSMHTGSWFQVGTSNDLLNVARGGRQGCKFGGVIFNLAYAKALRRFVANAEAEDIPMRLKGAPGFCPAHAHDQHRGRDVLLFDMTFVDDEAFVITSAVPASLTYKFNRAITLLVESFTWYGMHINWQPGKTEAMIGYRGKGPKRATEAPCQDDGSRKFIVQPPQTRRRLRVKTPTPSLPEVHVVDEYKHVGSIISYNNSLAPEARRRERSAFACFIPIASLLSNRNLTLKRRVCLALSFVMSRLFFNVHVWSTFGGKPRNILNRVYMRTWRRIVSDPRHGRTVWTDAQVLTLVEMATIEVFVRRRRLNYLSRLARTQLDALHTLLQQRDKFGNSLPWVQQLIGDLRALKMWHGSKLQDLPCPMTSIEPY